MATRPAIALTSAYGVVTEQQAEIKQLQKRITDLEQQLRTAQAEAEYLRSEWQRGCTFALRRLAR